MKKKPKHELKLYSDPVAKYLPEDVLTNLHMYKGKDYSREIRIEHLVSNTSGLPDYFEEKTKHGRLFRGIAKSGLTPQI